jgi:hypothetical protein
MAAYGSPEYALTWKHWDIQWGPPICALRASARRTSGSGCGGWPTPVVGDANGARSMTSGRSKGSKFSPGLNLSDLAYMGWPTPSAATFNDGQSAESNQARPDRLKAKHKNGNGAGMTLGGAAQLASGWTTPRSADYQGGMEPEGKTGRKLQTVAGWCTPASRDHRDSPGMAKTGVNPDGSTRTRMDHLPRQAHGATPISSPAETGTRGVLDPAFPRWLMGYPEAWDRTAPGSSEWTSAQQREAEIRG